MIRTCTLMVVIAVVISMIQLNTFKEWPIEVEGSSCVGNVIEFSVPKAVAWNGNVTWYMGDGTVYYGRTISHMYSYPGEYMVSCQIKHRGTEKTYFRRILVRDRGLIIPNSMEYNATYSVVSGMSSRFNPNGILKVGGVFAVGYEEIVVYGLNTSVLKGHANYVSFMCGNGKLHEFRAEMNVKTTAISNWGNVELLGNITFNTCLYTDVLNQEINVYVRTMFQGLEGTGSVFGTEDEMILHPFEPMDFYVFNFDIFHRAKITRVFSTTHGVYPIDNNTWLKWYVDGWLLSNLGPCLRVVGNATIAEGTVYRFSILISEDYQVPVFYELNITQKAEGNLTSVGLSLSLESISTEVKHHEYFTLHENHTQKELNSRSMKNLCDYGIPCNGHIAAFDRMFTVALAKNNGLMEYISKNPGVFVSSAKTYLGTDGTRLWEYWLGKKYSQKRYVFTIDESGVIQQYSILSLPTYPVYSPENIQRCNNISFFLNTVGINVQDKNTTFGFEYLKNTGICLDIYIGGDISIMSIYLILQQFRPKLYYWVKHYNEFGYYEAIYDAENASYMLKRTHRNIGRFVFP